MKYQYRIPPICKMFNSVYSIKRLLDFLATYAKLNISYTFTTDYQKQIHFSKAEINAITRV